MQKSDIEELLLKQNSQLIEVESEPIYNKTKIHFMCIYCSKPGSKQCKHLIPKSDELTAYCTECARIVAQKTFKETLKKRKLQEKEEEDKLINSIVDPSKEKYCSDCKVIHPIEYYLHFQTNELTNKCKVKRLKKSKTNGNAQRKYTIESLTELLKKDNSELHNVVNDKITTKTIVEIKCGECGTIESKRVNAISRTGGYCSKCANVKASVKKSESGKGRTFKIVNRNEEAYIDKRKYTIKDVQDMLSGYDTILIGDYDKKISTKQTIKFICGTEGCFNEREKQVRDVIRGGCFCKECTEDRRRQTLSELKKRPEQIVKDPLLEKICVECEWLKHIDQFKHDQNPNIKTSLCQTCRDKKKVRDKKRREMLLKKKVENPDVEKKCSSCYVIRDINNFSGDNITCNYCRRYGNTRYQKLQLKIHQFNNNNEYVKICKRCLYKYPTSDFKTDLRKIVGVLCSTCREYMFQRNDKIANHYLNIKMESGPCIDCGNDDIRVLEFDHVDRDTKRFNVSNCGSIKKLEEEMKKCVLRCGICHRKRTKIQCNHGIGILRRGKIHIDNIKKDIGSCAHCGWYDDECLEALEFDHIDPNTKKNSISTMVANSESIENIDIEIQKCQLLCVNCHKLKTIENNGYYLYKDIDRQDARQERINKI